MHARAATFLSLVPAATPSDSAGDLAQRLQAPAADPEHRGALVHWHTTPARAARTAELSRPLPTPLDEALGSLGISSLYSHQALAIESLRAGRDTVVVTGTAS